jgi:hypothetical protein
MPIVRLIERLIVEASLDLVARLAARRADAYVRAAQA